MTLPAPELPRMTGLERALELSRELKARVEAQDWEGAAALEAERRELLGHFFSSPPPAGELPETVRLLRELIEANDVLVGMAEHIQRGIAREAETVAIGRKAVLAYSNNAA